jgi:hypothetical protein
VWRLTLLHILGLGDAFADLVLVALGGLAHKCLV